jgi:hypothetical protein
VKENVGAKKGEVNSAFLVQLRKTVATDLRGFARIRSGWTYRVGALAGLGLSWLGVAGFRVVDGEGKESTGDAQEMQKGEGCRRPKAHPLGGFRRR